jgi:uncharacterized protein YhbP (UPF0306 family)
MLPAIERLLQKHHVLTLSTVSERGSWTAHCFYAWMPDRQALVFTTDPDTRHGMEMLANCNVSAGIALETTMVGKIRGIQLTGRAYPAGQTDESDLAAVCHAAYIRRFPFALAAKLELWILYPDYIKMTDNRLGFGKKLEWTREG